MNAVECLHIMSKLNHILYHNVKVLNPFSIYAYSWIIVLLVYSLDWSYLYPKLTREVLLFLICTSLMAMFLSIVHHTKFTPKDISDKNVTIGKLKIAFIILYILLFLEFAFVGGIPLFMYGSGRVDDDFYMRFGIPIVNVIVVNGFAALFLFSVTLLLYGNQSKKIILLFCLLGILPPVICVQRGIAMNMLIGAGCIYLIHSRHMLRKVISMSLVGIVVLYLFGSVGQIRFQGKEDAIIQIAEPTRKFDESIAPKEYIWSYLYIASPLANLQSFIDYDVYNKACEEEKGVLLFVWDNIVPQFMSKYFFTSPDVSYYLITRAMVVGSTYMMPFAELGWLGLILMFAYIIVFFIVFVKLVPRNSIWFFPLLAVLCEISLMGIFDNMVAYTGIFPQLILIFLGHKFLFK